MHNLNLKNDKPLGPQNPHPKDPGDYDNPWGGGGWIIIADI